MAELSLFVNLYPCGCACQACTPAKLQSMLEQDEYFRESMAAGRVRSVTEEEYQALSWGCATCRPAK